MTEASGRAAVWKQHPLFRAATIYAIGGWLLIQFGDISLETFDAPAWIMQTFLILVLGGFPVMLTCLWLFGQDRHDTHSRSVVPIATIVVAVVLSVAAYQYFSASDTMAVQVGTVASHAGEGEDEQVRDSNPVLAVLPFANMSSLEENEYLADGMTEDIITLLAQSPGVEVIARNSTFKYKNQNPDIRDVAQDLGADYVIEGSIRPVGDRLRVTVQVIEASSGAHIWAEKYDRPLADFFAVQDEVSLGVAAAVGDAVFREEFDQINRSLTDNLTAWAVTAQAEVEFNNSQRMADPSWLGLPREAVRLDPGYALAQAVLGRSLSLYALAYDTDQLEEAEAAARLAIRLAPNDPKVLAYLAITLLWTGQPEEALTTARRVLDISPSYAEGLAYYADILIHNGRSEESIPYFDKAIRLTPNAPQLGFYHLLRGEALMHHGNFAEAERSLLEANRYTEGASSGVLRYLAGAQLRLDKVDEAIASLRTAEQVDGRAVGEMERMMRFYSTDGGGEYFDAVWADLAEL